VFVTAGTCRDDRRWGVRAAAVDHLYQPWSGRWSPTRWTRPDVPSGIFLRLVPPPPRCDSEGCRDHGASGGLKVGDIVVLLPGERIPVDGVGYGGRGARGHQARSPASPCRLRRQGIGCLRGHTQWTGRLEVQTVKCGDDTTLAGSYTSSKRRKRPRRLSRRSPTVSPCGSSPR